MNKIYKYANHGRYLEILAYDTSFGYYLTPTEDDDDAIMIEYTLAAGTVEDEADVIDIDHSLGRALVHYVKMRLLQDMGNYQAARIEEGEFYKYLSRSNNSRMGTAARAARPKGAGVLL